LFAQFVYRILGACQLCLLGTAAERFRENVVRADNDLQRLPQIVADNCQ